MRTPVYATSRAPAGNPPATEWRAPSPAVPPAYMLASKAVGLVTLLLAPLWFSALLFAGDYEYTTAIGLIPLLVIFNLGLVVLVSRRDPLLRMTMISATILKVASAGVYLVMSYRVYESGADALHYFTVGQDLVSNFWARGDWPLMMPLWSTNLLNTLTAYVIILVGASLPAIFVIFALVSLWGSYFFYRAFCAAFPAGNRAAALLMFFFVPSVMFWTACIGKDAVIALFLGMTAYGFALSRVRPAVPSYLLLGAGLLGTMAVRPHVAAMLATAIVMPYLFSRNRRGMVGAVYKGFGIALLTAASVFMVTQAKDFLQVSDFKSASKTLEHITTVNRLGGSAYGAQTSLPVRVALAPFLLFRPLPWEAHNLQSGVAALEGLVLLVFFWRARKGMLQLLRDWRANPYVLLILLYAVEFCLAFAAASSNFGTLSRMRVMLLPFALMLLCAPPVVAKVKAGRRRIMHSPVRRAPLPETH